MKTFFQRLATLTALSVIVISCLEGLPALGQKSVTIQFKLPPPPPDRGAPGNRGEGASRGDCAVSSLPLTALVPSYEQKKHSTDEGNITQVWGLTSVEQPSFWFYVPYHQSSIQAIEFVLQTEQNKTIQRTNVSVPTIPGIVRVQLQNSQILLKTNKPYHWFLKVKVVCPSQQLVTLNYVEGWVQRVNLDVLLRERIQQSSPLEQAAIYAANGIWYDAFTTLAELRLTNSQDPQIIEGWNNLLKVIQLEKLATKPLIN
ncbi:DUF928 domain-containing protein [Nostoc sp. FACHB-280]|uniref:DUF928 domain-containing protein n=1 Tax=Nostoc sp. FACHB-280 TaxID=2692839 RepID=UPI00168AD0EE|nr:DUF928 domain-containing protein [Nostoc sp. FACHB-280]MBD2497920.1 DUF928 domain-containing protein [Nostoc sp. FACHB-280]